MMLEEQNQDFNKSSSFYGEKYYEKARKQANDRKKVYRQRSKELYDQQHELEPQKIYRNHSGRCEMIHYYANIVELYFILKGKNIKGSDEYNEAANQFMTSANERIKYFHQHLMCNQFELFEDWKKRMMAEKEGNVEPTTNQRGKCEMKIEGEQAGSRRRYDTCNQCPILIEQFEISLFGRLDNISKHTSNWEKLNGKQKMTKFKCFVEQHLKILKFQLENKCEFVLRAKSYLLQPNAAYFDIECL